MFLNLKAAAGRVGNSMADVASSQARAAAEAARSALMDTGATATRVGGAITALGTGAVAAVPETLRTIVDPVTGLAREVRVDFEVRRLAAEAMLGDAFWAVKRPFDKSSAVALGMAVHVAPILIERAVDKVTSRLFGSPVLALAGPAAPVVATVFAVIDAIELYHQVTGAIDQLGVLCAEADARLDVEERRRLDERRREAEERLARLQGVPLVAATAHAAAVVQIAAPGTAPSFDVALLDGPFAQRTLSELSAAEVEGLAKTEGDEGTRELIQHWIDLRIATGQ